MLRILVGIAMCFGTAVQAASADDVHALFDDYWANEMRNDPFGATGSGVFDYNTQVPSITPADYARQLEEAKAFLTRLEEIDRSDLNSEDQLSADLLAFILKHDVALAPYDGWRIPFLADTGFHSSFSYVVGSTPFRSEKDYRDYLMRLRAFPGYLAQNIANMRQGLADGFTQPKEILPLILPSFRAQVKETAQEHPFYRPFENIASVVPVEIQAELQREATSVIEGQILPAYRNLLTFMEDEYVPGARDTLGASAMPNGRAYYENLVRFYTTLDDATPEGIHEIGLREVARIRKEMDEIIAETGFEGSFAEFVEFLRTDPQFYAKTPQALLERAAWISKDIDGRLPGFFGKMPRQPYSVEPVPDEIAPNYTTGRYVGAPLDSDRGGQYWVNTYALDKRPLYTLTALSLHEGVPGHHFQSALAKEIENVPEFRKRFYPHAFGEGWGLYTEKLGVEMGVYLTPYDHFGRLTYEMWRACRLVIDTGIHAMGWSRKQAMDYLASNTALSLHNVQTEVDRYIAWPGQALAYKMGEITIWELRQDAEEALGDKFDIRAFHDALLTSGGMPMAVLKDRMGEWTRAQQNKR